MRVKISLSLSIENFQKFPRLGEGIKYIGKGCPSKVQYSLR